MQVSPGSDLHVLLAARHAQRAAVTQDAGAAQVGAANAAAVAAVTARYGRASDALAQRLLDLNLRMHE